MNPRSLPRLADSNGPAPDENGSGTPAGFFPLRLVLTPGGHTLELDRPSVLLGRHTDADVRLPTPDVSRRHCRFLFTAGVWEVYDLDSLNGLFVNGERVRQTSLQSGDLVAVGSFRLRVDFHSDAAAGAVAAPSDSARRVWQSITEALPRHPHE